jgi:hypothetical protein
MTKKETITQKIKKRFPKLTKDGSEIVSSKPKVIPAGIKRPPTQEERLRRIIAAHRAAELESQAYSDETDFDIDEPDMLTPYEVNNQVFDTVPEVPQERSTEAPTEPATPIAEDPVAAPAESPEATEG